MSVNDVARAIQSLINRPTAPQLAVALGISLVVMLVAMVLLLAGKRKWLALGTGIAGLAAAVLVLFIVDQQSYTTRESESITVTRPRYRERTRALARGGLLGLPGVAVLVGVGAWASARRRLRRSIPGLLKAGRMHLFLKEYEPALERFTRAIRIAPYLADAYCGRGAVYQGLGDVERARADYDQAIQCDPRSTHALLQRSRIRADSGEVEGALADLTRVMEIQPSDPELYLNRGICYFKKGLMSDAAADFQRVLKLTNHTDFAEPAKDYLRQIEGHGPGSVTTPVLPSTQSNGISGSTALPDARARDHTA